jgi:hypothetical protein
MDDCDVLRPQVSVHALAFLSSDVLVTCGLNHVHVWTIDQHSLRRTRGIFGRKVAKQARQHHTEFRFCFR